jgi:hypothetical protein
MVTEKEFGTMIDILAGCLSGETEETTKYYSQDSQCVQAEIRT